MLDIDSMIKQAMKSKNKTELEAYKNIKVEIQKNQTAKGAKPLTEQLQLAIIAKYAATLEHAIYEFQEAHRDDLVAEYSSEWEVVKKLLPEPVNELQIYSLINEWENLNGYFPTNSITIHSIDTVAFQIHKKEMGNVIKYVKSKVPTADGKMISEIVKKYII